MTDEELINKAKRLGIEWVNDIRWYYATDGHKILSAASRREVIAAIAAQGAKPEWLCPSCKADRFKEDCKGDRMKCPMTATAQGANK